MSGTVKNIKNSFDEKNPPKKGVASKIRWARPDLVFEKTLATVIFGGITPLQDFVEDFERLNEDLALDEEVDVLILAEG